MEEQKGIYKIMSKLIIYLSSAAFGVKLLLGSVIVQGFHSYYTFYQLSSYEEILAIIISSAFYSIVLSSAILFFTLRNKKRVALIFAIFESGINLYYFTTYLLTKGQVEGLIISIPISLMLPYTIYSYSDAIIEAISEMKQNLGLSNLSNYAKLKMKDEILEEVNKKENETLKKVQDKINIINDKLNLQKKTT